MVRRIRGDLAFGHHGVDGQQHLARCAASALASRSLRRGHQIRLQQRATHPVALSVEEGVGHAAADDQHIDLVQQVLQHAQLALTLAPPITAAKGRCGLSSAPPSASSSCCIRKPATAGNAAALVGQLTTPAVEAWARWALPKASLT